MPFPSSEPTISFSSKDILSFAFDNPKHDKDQPVLIDPRDPSIHLTWRTAREMIQSLIAGLYAAGLKEGDTVGIHSFNSIYYPCIMLAIIGAGGLAVGTNPGYTRAELNHGVKVAKMKFVLAEPEILNNFLRALKDNNIDVGSKLFVLDTQHGQKVPDGLRSWRWLMKHGKKDWIRFDDEDKSINTVAQLYYTSGTTGLPKCAMTTHRNMTAEHQLYWGQYPKEYKHKLVFCMPFFHVGISPQVLVSAFKDGREAYVMRRFDLVPFLNYYAKYELTELFIVPPMVNAIVMSGLADPKSPNYRADCSLKTVRCGHVGAAPCSGDMQKRINLLCADDAIYTQVWGMTETTSMATRVPAEIAVATRKGELETWGTVGKALPGISLKLINENGEDVTSKGRGELCVKGPVVVKGYFENEQATSDSWDNDGYFKTGDVAQTDEHGLLYIVDRVKELIKVRGFQVGPPELEGVLTEHPDITDAAVVGIKVDQDTEAPRAYIVRRKNTKLAESDVHKWMGERLSRYKQLTGGIVFIDEVPKSPSGKILKRVIRDWVKKEECQNGAPKL